jgi:hypothetical protein
MAHIGNKFSALNNFANSSNTCFVVKEIDPRLTATPPQAAVVLEELPLPVGTVSKNMKLG